MKKRYVEDYLEYFIYEPEEGSPSPMVGLKEEEEDEYV